MKRILAITVAVLGFASTSLAAGGSGFYFGINLDISGSSSETASGKTSTSGVVYDLNLGYLGASGLYLGLLFGGGSVNTDNGSGSSPTSVGQLGPSVGYMSPSGFMVIGHYILQTTVKTDTTTWQKGSGIGLDIGYVFKVNSTLSVGPMLVYRSFEYKELDVNGTKTDSSLKTTSYEPKINFSFLF